MGKKRKVKNNLKDDSTVNKKIKHEKNKDEIIKDLDSNENVCESDNKTSSKAGSNSDKLKKVIFTDDKPQEVLVALAGTEKSRASKKMKRGSKILKESDVKDEDTVQKNAKGDSIVSKNVKEKRNKGKITKIIDKNVNVDDRNTEEVCLNIVRRCSSSEKPKKIIFVDDEPQEVLVVPSDTKKSKAGKKRNEENREILREEDVKDEDIDKFCDELDEEDNKQFEDWVQLIEANFNSNKKKSK